MTPFLRKLSWLARRTRKEAELQEELQSYLDEATDEGVAKGIPVDAARRAAQRDLGSVSIVLEDTRAAWTWTWLAEVAQDVRYAVRMLIKTPGFSLVAIVTLALGIGANTAIFSLVSAVLLRPLPFPDADRLVLLWDDVSAQTAGRVSLTEPAPADYVAWKAQSQSFTDMAAIAPATFTLTGVPEPQKLEGTRTTANVFTVLGMRPLIGRTLTAADDRPDANPVVVINERFWRSTFGSDPDVVGRSVLLNGQGHIVVGVVPSDFPFPQKDSALWVPARFTPEELAVRNSYVLDVVARLKPGVDQRAATAEMNTIAQRLGQQFPANHGIGVAITPLHDYLARSAKPAMTMLMGAVIFVLLIACVNVANLLLARGASRQRELALRKALGAANGRIVRQLLTESAVLAAAGAAAGLALSRLTFTYLARLVPGGLPSGTAPMVNLSVLLFAGMLTFVVVLGFGVGPAVIASQVPLDAALKAGARGASGSGHPKLRNGLLIAEISLTIVLVIAAGLLLRSYAKVLAVAPGFQPSHLLVAETVLSPSKYGALAARSAFYRSVLDRVRALPTVIGAGYVNAAPLTSKGGRSAFVIDGEPPLRPEDILRHLALNRSMTPGYFETLGVSLVRGRFLDARDRDGAPLSVVVNERFAATRWPNQDAVGRRLRLPAPNSPWFTVVGVLANMRETGRERPVEAEVYFSADQVAVSSTSLWPQHILVRTAGDPFAVAAAVRKAVSDVDQNEPVSNIRSMEQVFAADVLDRNTQMLLVTTFAALALVMASVGLYGMLSYSVTRRTREIGVRMALGAQRTTVVMEIVGGVLLLAAVGILLGIAGAFVATRILRASLFSVSAADPATFAVTATLVMVTSLLASAVPAFRGAGVNPSVTLRAE